MNDPEQAHDLDGRRAVAAAWVQVQRPVTAYVMSFLPDRSDVDDVIQATAMAMVEAFDSFDRSKPVLAWVLGIARNKVADHLRATYRDKVMFPASALDAIESAYLDVVHQQNDISDAMSHCLKELGGRRRQALRFRYVDGLRPAEISREMGCTAQVVYSLLKHGRQSLRECVQRRVPSIRLGDDR